MEVRKPIAEEEAFNRLAAKCATAEYCIFDMRRKMERWLLKEGAEERIIARLLKDNFINEERYAHAFVRDKFRYNHWGWVRIERELMMRGIPQEYINEAHEEIDPSDNLESLRQLIETKKRSVKGKNEYEIKGKLFRFAISRGFKYDDINRVLDSHFTFDPQDD